MENHNNKTFTEEEVIQAIKDEYKKEYGALGDNEKYLDGYFITGFVREALENKKEKDSDNNKKAGYK